MNSLSAAELAIYIILCIPVLYILVRHWPNGVLGWFYLFAFCTLRIISGAMSLKNHGGSASIISSVGISPLLLAACGILHEARAYRAINLLQKPFEVIIVTVFHMFVTGGLALVAAGASALQNHHSSAATALRSLRLLQAGMAILTVSWVLLVLCAVASAWPLRKAERNAVLFRDGTILLLSVIFSLIFIGIRVLYSLVAFSTQKPYLNPATGSLTIRVLLSFLPELIATCSFIFAGVQTRRIARDYHGVPKS
ncbi:hypothetical protein VMCG_02020 [Cytospora schulzeri]|uniref:DUF7702 domain-containing protein n=1 Tax=Cytospora schulzeri TaxID=448051 RepID=A0A423X3P3_9PEZI|nr:hypothetical protein VMCG_02020 [Valsa malicola]